MPKPISKLKMLLNRRKFVETHGSSNLEKEFQLEVLDLLNVKYIPQYHCGGKYFDFFIPHIKLLIEVDGDYWHGNLSLFVNDIQKKAKRNDIVKNNIAKGFKYNIIRIREIEIKNNIQGVRLAMGAKIQELELKLNSI